MSQFFAGKGTSSATSTTLISKQTANNSATISFTSFASSTFKSYIVLFRDIVAQNNADTFNMVFSNNNGVSYINSNYSWSFIFSTSAGGFSQVANHGVGSAFFEIAASVPNTTLLNGQIQLFDINTTNLASYYGQIIEQNSGANAETDISSGVLVGATGINAIQFSCSTGNIASGTITLLGVIEP